MISSHVDTSMMTLHEKSLKKHLTWRTHILSFVASFELIYMPLEIYFSWLKLSRRHQSLKMPKNTLKMSFFVYTQLSLKENRVHTRLALYNTCIRTWVAIYNSHVRLIYMTLCIGNLRMPPRVRECCFWNPRTPPENVKKQFFWISGSLGSYATDSFSCNYFVFTPNSSLTI